MNMNLSELINEILSEWAYRCDDGMPNPKNPTHLKELGDVLSEMGLSHIKNTLVENLLMEKGKTPERVKEAEGSFTNPILNKKIKYKNTKGEDAEGIVGNLLRLPAEHPGRKAAEALLPADDSPERDAINKDLGGQGQAAKPEDGKDKKGGEEAGGGEEEKAKAAQAMFDPKNDPAMAARMDTEKEVQAQLAKDAEADKEVDKEQEPKENDGFNPIDAKDVAKEMPQADPETFNGDSDIPDGVTPEQLEQFNTDIAKVAQQVADAKAKGEPAPNINLCDVTVPGTNLYCDDNLGIPRDEMPQFKGTAQPGSRAASMEVDKDGEVDTEPVFKEMLKEKGIKTLQTQIPADKLKATQKDLVGAKVVGMMGALEKDPNHPKITAPIYVSRDGHVIDGHHRWAAIVAYNAAHPDAPIPMKTTVLDMDIKDAIPMANKFAEDMGIAAKKADANKEAPTSTDTKNVASELKNRKSSDGEDLDVETTENGSMIIGVEHGTDKESNKQAIEQIQKLPKDTKVMFVGEGGSSKDKDGNIEFGGEQDEIRNGVKGHFDNAEESSWDENADVLDDNSQVYTEIEKELGSKSKAKAAVWTNMYGQDGPDENMKPEDYLDDEGKQWIIEQAKKGGSSQFDGEVDWNNLTDAQKKDLYELNYNDEGKMGDNEIMKGQQAYNGFRQKELDRKIKEAEDNGYTVIAPVGNSHVDMWRNRNKKTGATSPTTSSPSTPTSAPKLTDTVKQKISNWTEKEKAFFDRNEGAPGSKERRSLGEALKAKAAGALKAIKKGAKHEVEEFKEAGKGVQNFFSGKPLSEKEQKAVKAVAFKVVTTAVFGAAFGGLSHGVAAFGKHVAMEFIPHIIGETILKGVGKAAVFADTEGEAEMDTNILKFTEMIAKGLEEMEITPEMMEQMVDSYNEKKENGEVENETPTVKAEHLHLVDELMLEMIYGFIDEIKPKKEDPDVTYTPIGKNGKPGKPTTIKYSSAIKYEKEHPAYIAAMQLKGKGKGKKTQPTKQPVGKIIAPSGFRNTGEKKLEPDVNYDKLTADQKKKMVDAIVDKNNAGFNASKNKEQFAIKTISARNEDINEAHILPPGTPGSSFAENNGAKYVNNFFNGGITKEKIEAAMEEMLKTPLAQKIQPESVRRAWAQVAVRTAVNEAQTLKNVPSYNAKNPQPKGLPQGAIMDAQNKAMVRTLLESKRDEAIANGDKKAETHYKKQLGYLDKLKETDTGIIYETNDGTIGFKHTSNKKTFKDPHSNSSPAKVMEAMRKTMGGKLSPELEKIFKESEQLLADSNQTVVNDTKSFVESQLKKSPKQKTTENEAIGNVLSKFPLSGGGKKDYINGPDGVTNKPWFKKYAAEKGLTKPYSNDTVLSAVYKNAASDNADQNAIDTVLKISEMVQNVNPKNIENTAKKYGITPEQLNSIVKSTEQLKETGRKRREVMVVVHTKIVKGIQEADASDPNSYPTNPNGENGPHQQAYVNDFLSRMHFTAYVMGERDGVSSHNINGVNVEPSFYRECLAQLTGFKGDTKTSKGREELLTHMKKGLRVSPENDSIIFQDGKTKAKVGTETYRTKGKSKGVLGYLGPDLQKCLEGKADKKK